MKNYRRGLYLFNQDLRLNDNLALSYAQQSCEQLVYCYIIDHYSLSHGRYGMPTMGHHRFQFITQALQQLNQQLEEHGHQLVVLQGEPLTVISELINSYQLDAVFGSHQPGVYESRRWQQLARRFPYLGIEQRFATTLFSAQQLPFDLAQLPRSYSQFRKAFEPLNERLPAKQLAQTDFSHPPVNSTNVPRFPVASDTPNAIVNGGPVAAEQHLQEYFNSPAPSTYKQTRNALDNFASSTKLSAYLAQGNLSPQQVVNAVRRYEEYHGANESTYWILFELMWREYFYWYLTYYQQRVFKFSGINNHAPKTSFYPSRFKRWCSGTTPYPLVNAAMKQLNQTGYLSNRARQIVASCLVNELSLDWRYGAAYFEQQLIDYDVASNWGNWQYIAGVGADPRGGRHFNIDKQAQQFDPEQHYIKRWQGGAGQPLDQTDAADWPLS